MTSLPNPVMAPARVHVLLDHFHKQSSNQEAAIEKFPSAQDPGFDDQRRDKFIALDQDKCHFVYQILRAINAKNVVEIGTSFGVSTIYLALAVGSNVKASGGEGKAIATDKEPSKAEQANANWKEAGEDLVTKYIDLRVGDLNETLKFAVPTIDFVLLDIWTPVALPVLKLLELRLRPGAVVIIGNTIGSAKGYAEFLAYLRSPNNGYTNLTLPYAKGLELCVKV